MATQKIIRETTPNGGAYSEIYFFDKDGKAVDENYAVKCAIRECKENGEMISETFAFYGASE